MLTLFWGLKQDPKQQALPVHCWQRLLLCLTAPDNPRFGQKDDLEAIVVSLKTGIRNADEPYRHVTGANVRDQDTELFVAAFQLLDCEIVLRHLFSP